LWTHHFFPFSITTITGTLIVADSPSTDLRPIVSAAKKINKPISILTVGGSYDNASLAKISGVNKILTVNNDTAINSPETMAEIIKKIQSTNNFTHIFAPSSIKSKDYIPRFAAQINTQPLTDITAVVDESTFVRNTYAGNAINTVKSNDPVKIAIVRASAFQPEQGNDGSAAIETIDCTLDNINKATFVKADVAVSDRPDLATAKIVISGGRGMKNGENFDMLYKLADKLGGAAVGASRAAVDSGFVSNDLQVGQTGKIVAPNLYIAVGISGAIQHLAGMKDSKTIVAINKDADAPIFQIADYGLVADLFDVIPQMEQKL
jgi:electron transfer flavoprotein alpha subunit